MKYLTIACVAAVTLLISACDNGEVYGSARQAAIEAGYTSPELAWVSSEDGYICKDGEKTGHAYAFRDGSDYGLVCIYGTGAKIVAITPQVIPETIMPETPYPLPTED